MGSDPERGYIYLSQSGRVNDIYDLLLRSLRGTVETVLIARIGSKEKLSGLSCFSGATQFEDLAGG